MITYREISKKPRLFKSFFGVTVIEFDSPQQAGYERWPATVVEEAPSAQAEGLVLAGDYSEMIREFLAEAQPGIWDTYEFGQEPRRYTFTETIRFSYPDVTEPDVSPQSKKAARKKRKTSP